MKTTLTFIAQVLFTITMGIVIATATFSVYKHYNKEDNRLYNFETNSINPYVQGMSYWTYIPKEENWIESQNNIDPTMNRYFTLYGKYTSETVDGCSGDVMEPLNIEKISTEYYHYSYIRPQLYQIFIPYEHSCLKHILIRSNPSSPWIKLTRIYPYDDKN
jgi:hypothetical protein